MHLNLQEALKRLKASEPELRNLGANHVAIFGSVARGESNAKSDIDVLVELDESQSLGLFEYSRLRIYLNDILGGSADVVNARTLKPMLRGNIERDAVNAF